MAKREAIDFDGLWMVLLIAVVIGGTVIVAIADDMDRKDRERAKCRADLFRVTTADSIRIIRHRPECAP